MSIIMDKNLQILKVRKLNNTKLKRILKVRKLNNMHKKNTKSTYN